MIASSIAASGCRPKPVCHPDDGTGCVVTKLRIEQRPREVDVATSDIEAHIATAESSTLVTDTAIKIFQGTGELFLRYERLDKSVLDRDLLRIERYLRARGYYEAKVRAARTYPDGESSVKVQIVVAPGEPTLLKKVDLHFVHPLPASPSDLGLSLTRIKADLKRDKPFEEASYDRVKQKLARALTDRGFARATVTGRVDVDLAQHQATATFDIDTGPPCLFGKVLLEGHGDLPEGPLRAAIDIEPGEPFSTEALDRAQQALMDTGVLSGVSIDIFRTFDPASDRPSVPVRFRVQRGSLRSLVVGGGAELGSAVRAHVVTSWEHKNFLGGMRRLFVDAKVGARFYPLQLVNWDVPDPGVRVLPEARTTAELRQPGLFEKRTTGAARIELKFFRPDTADTGGTPSALLYENFEAHGTTGIERPFFRSVMRAGASLNAQIVTPIPMYTQPGQQALPDGFGAIYMPYLEANAELDLRRGRENKPDPLNPRSGFYAGANVQAAFIFPEAGWDVRIRPEIRGYIPIAGDVTLALRLAGGMLFPFGYGSRLFDTEISCLPGDFACAGNPCNGDPTCEAVRSRSLQIAQLRGFYSGGLDSNRGYPRNGVNPQEEVLALLQAGSAGGISKRSPIGGRWLYEAQLELRFPIVWGFLGAVFADAGDAWYGELALRPHLSVGLGLRYMTPIGPLRADIGVRIPCAQEVGTCDPRPVEQGGPPDLAGLPVNIAIAVGHPY